MLSAIVAIMYYLLCGDSLIALHIVCLMRHITIKPQGDLVPQWLYYIAKCFS